MYYFIVNPSAGGGRCGKIWKRLERQLERQGIAYEAFLTERSGDAAGYAMKLTEGCRDPRIIITVGGDGTMNEVANGAAGCANAAVTCIPVGTGNDFLKNFGDQAALFADPENLWDGPVMPLDAIDCNGRLALTVACSGFDAQVADDVHTYGKLPLLGGQGSYILSLGVNFLLRSLGRQWTITLDGETLEGEFALAAVCNGRYYGGGFMPVAEARMDDGVLNTLLVRKVSRPTFLRFVGAYAKGLYHTLPGIAKCYSAREITIESRDRDIVTCLDGECARSRRVDIRLSEKKVNFFGPKGCDPNATCIPLPEAGARGT